MVAELVGDLTTLLADGAEALTLSGDLTASRRHFEEAYQFAVRAGDHQAMSIAALGAGGIWVHEHRTAAGSAARVRWLATRAPSPQGVDGCAL